MHYYLMFAIRRFMFVMIAFFLSDLVAFQIMLNIAMTMVNQAWLMHSKPFEDYNLNQLELINEGIILLVGYTLFPLTDFN